LGEVGSFLPDPDRRNAKEPAPALNEIVDFTDLFRIFLYELLNLITDILMQAGIFLSLGYFEVRFSFFSRLVMIYVATPYEAGIICSDYEFCEAKIKKNEEVGAFYQSWLLHYEIENPVQGRSAEQAVKPSRGIIIQPTHLL
jgi:hypothetical protein